MVLFLGFFLEFFNPRLSIVSPIIRAISLRALVVAGDVASGAAMPPDPCWSPVTVSKTLFTPTSDWQDLHI